MDRKRPQQMKLPAKRGTDLKLKFTRPGPIRTFDDSDLSECQGVSQDNGVSVGVPTSKAAPKQVALPKSVPNHLLLVSMLEQLCIIYSRNSRQAQEMFHSICDQLTKLNVVSPLIVLDEMSSLRSQYRLSVHRMLIAAIHKTNKGSLLPLPALEDGQVLLPALPASITAGQPSITDDDIVNLQTSRYQTEFVEQQKVGKGGFGSVYKAKNKLDGKLYAVKKVKFKHSKPEVWLKVLREVKALANLQHSNIVGYNSCWLEYSNCISKSTAPVKAPEPPVDVTEDSIIVFAEAPNAVDFVYSGSESLDWADSPKIKELSSDSYSEVSSPEPDPDKVQSNPAFVDDSCSSNQITEFSEMISKENFELRSVGEFGESVQFTSYSRESRRSRRVHFRRSFSLDPVLSGEATVPDLNPDDFPSSRRQFSLKKTVTLYIQMELCSLTLKEWMQARNEKCSSDEHFIAYTGTNMNIFQQILLAVDYIHSQGVMHRDLKPRNIFLLEDGLHVKVGDFGLATDDTISPTTEEPELATSPTSPLLSRTGSMLSEDHTSGVGTSTYAAPEQLVGSVYNTKCDIYSLGVILFELFQHFKTEMERYNSLEQLRSGLLPSYMNRSWPEQTAAIKQMTSVDPYERKTARELLNSELFISKEQIISDLQKDNTKLQREIEELQQTLKKKDKMIENLRHELANTGAFPGTYV